MRLLCRLLCNAEAVREPVIKSINLKPTSESKRIVAPATTVRIVYSSSSDAVRVETNGAKAVNENEFCDDLMIFCIVWNWTNYGTKQQFYGERWNVK